VHIPRERIGQIICDSPIPRSNQPAGIEYDIVIDPEFVPRESTGPAPIA
jgi:DNA-binding LacI/PurR family transcriptional regulator